MATPGSYTFTGTVPSDTFGAAPPPPPRPNDVAIPRPLLSPEETVEDRYTRIVDSDSPLMEQAKTSGLQLANSRGLLNSSIAVGAAGDAAARAALPVAQQDAGAAFQRGQGREVFGQTKELNTQQFGFNTQLQGQQQAATAALSAQEAGQQLRGQTQAERAERERQIAAIQAQQNISRQEAEQQLRSQTQGETAQIVRQTQAEAAALTQQTQQENFQMGLAQFNQEAAVNLQNIQNRNQVLLAASEDARNYSAALNQQIAQILTDDGLDEPTKRNMINALIDQAQPYFDLQQALLEAAGIEGLDLGTRGNFGEAGPNDTVTNADGSQTTTNPDGTQTTRDPEGNVVEPTPEPTPTTGGPLPSSGRPGERRIGPDGNTYEWTDTGAGGGSNPRYSSEWVLVPNGDNA